MWGKSTLPLSGALRAVSGSVCRQNKPFLTRPIFRPKQSDTILPQNPSFAKGGPLDGLHSMLDGLPISRGNMFNNPSDLT